MQKKMLLQLMLGLLLMQMSMAQTPYTRSADPKDTSVTVLKGMITKYILMNESAFKWFSGSHDSYTAPETVVRTLADHSDKMSFILFGGTWCDDTQFILPKFFRLQELSGIPDSAVTFFGVDREKKTLGGLSEALHITNVPTIIVFSNGKEIGRVVEYGTTGKWETELAAIVKQSAN